MAKRSYHEFFQGKSKWTHLDAPDTMYNPEGKWSIQEYLNEESLAKALALIERGLKNKIKKDEDGTYISWSRPVQKRFGGITKHFDPPQIFDKDGMPLSRDTRIGHGSDVTVKVEIYTHNTPQKTEAVAARLVSVRVDNMLPFNKDTELTWKEQKAAKGLDKQPEQLF